jgi:hypothetical protein
LCQVAKSFSKSCGPHLSGDWIFGKLLVGMDGFSNDWMDDGRAEVFEVKRWLVVGWRC